MVSLTMFKPLVSSKPIWTHNPKTYSYILCDRGTTKLSDDEVFALYDGTHVPLEDMNTFYGTVSSVLKS